MFDVSLLDKFYTYEPNMISDELFQIDEEIKQAYLMFIGVLVPVVSFSWRNYIKYYISDSSQPTYVKSNLTISDEAYTIWLIKQHLPNIVNAHNNLHQEHEPTNKKKGPHLTKIFINEYNNEFHKINLLRNQKETESHSAYQYYEQMFFNCFFDNNGPVFSLNESKKGFGMSGDSKLFIESLDEDKPVPATEDCVEL